MPSMTQSLAYTSASTSNPWDASSDPYVHFDDYAPLDTGHYTLHPTSISQNHPTVVPHSRPSSSSSSQSRTAHQPRFESSSWQSGPDLYHFAVQDPVDSPLTSPEPEAIDSPVKKEDEQDDFVFEGPAANDPAAAAFPAFSTMTEVPLRATQASKEMRQMMGVFRLDPFTMHNAVRDPLANVNWKGEPIGPLTEEPVMLEFQLEIVTDQSVKEEPPPALHYLPDNADASRKHRRLSPTYVPAQSPPESVEYALLDSPASSHLEDSTTGWAGSSPDAHNLEYSSDMLRHQQPFQTVLTPAQGLEASMAMTYKYSSPSSMSPSASSCMSNFIESFAGLTL